jgi:Flp pilus assembly pilin Flp
MYSTLQYGHMMQLFNNFLSDDRGQDLIEYSLLIGFVALASAAIFMGAGGNIAGIWSTSNSQLVLANSQAS